MNLNKLYRRNTHKNGEYRRDMEDTWKVIPPLFNVIHSLDSDKWMSLIDILDDILSYAKCFPFENDLVLAAHPEYLEACLELLVNLDMVESK